MTEPAPERVAARITKKKVRDRARDAAAASRSSIAMARRIIAATMVRDIATTENTVGAKAAAARIKRIESLCTRLADRVDETEAGA